MNNYKGYLQKV